MIFKEEGLPNRLSLNDKASSIAKRNIVGDVIVMNENLYRLSKILGVNVNDFYPHKWVDE